MGVFTILTSPIHEVAFHDCPVISKSCLELILIDQVWIELSDKYRDGVNLDSLDTWDNTRC